MATAVRAGLAIHVTMTPAEATVLDAFAADHGRPAADFLAQYVSQWAAHNLAVARDATRKAVGALVVAGDTVPTDVRTRLGDLESYRVSRDHGRVLTSTDPEE